MRVTVNTTGEARFGTFLGLISTDHGDMAVVKMDEGLGLYLETVHASRVTPITKRR